MNKTTSTHRQTLARRLKRDAQRMAALLDSSDDDGFDGLDDFALEDLGLGARRIGSAQAEWIGGPRAPHVAAREWL